ncbi:Peptide methionine sulfoxide reductase B5 [Phytophthora ramorum]|nr:Peptide methionine sulfoxide reductase B5 [Phytophthora ramorum]
MNKWLRALVSLPARFVSPSLAGRNSAAASFAYNMSSNNSGGAGNLSDAEWKQRLTPMQFQVLRLKGTERAGTGEYNKHQEQGVYVCAGCKTPVYTSTTKFDSGCGWPAFYDAIPGAIKAVADADGRRTEIMCAKCDGHMGHVFKGEGFKNPTDERHCVNSVSLVFRAGLSSL